MKKPIIAAVAAIGRNRVLGRKNKLLWHIPDDLKRFKDLTTGHPVIMGRKTFDSIIGYLGKPLPNRTNIVVTHNPEVLNDFVNRYGVVAVNSIASALSEARKREQDEIFVVGGAQIYELALPYTDVLHLTIINDEQEGDSYFPAYESEFAKKTFEEHREWNGLQYSWVDLVR